MSCLDVPLTATVHPVFAPPSDHRLPQPPQLVLVAKAQDRHKAPPWVPPRRCSLVTPAFLSLTLSGGSLGVPPMPSLVVSRRCKRRLRVPSSSAPVSPLRPFPPPVTAVASAASIWHLPPQGPWSSLVPLLPASRPLCSRLVVAGPRATILRAFMLLPSHRGGGGEGPCVWGASVARWGGEGA